MSTLAFCIASVLLLVTPFGEGGRRPDVLAAVQTLSFALASLAAIVTLGRSGPARPRGRGTWLLALALAIPAFSLLSAAAAAFPYSAFLGVMDRLATLLLFVAAAALLNEEESLRRLRAAVVAATSIQALFAIAGAFQAGPAGAAHIFLNRSQLGAYLCLGLFLASAAAIGAVRRRDPGAAALWSGAVLLHLAALPPLQSRGVLVALVCGGALLTAVSWRDLPKSGRAILAIVLLLTLSAGGLMVARRFAENDDPDRFTRVSIWRASLSMALEHPVLGLGPGQFTHEAPRHNFPLERSPVRYGRQFSGAHSFPLTLLVEEGVPGFLLATALAIGIAGTLLRAARRGSDLQLGVAAALTAIGAQAFVEDLQDRPAILLTAALLAGAACGVARGWRLRPPQAGLDPDAAPRGWGDPLPAGAILLVGACLVAGGVLCPFFAWRDAAAARALGAAGLPRLQRAAAIDPLNPWHREGLAMAALQGGPPDRERYAAAAIELDTALRLAPREPRLLLLRARLEAIAARSLFPAPATIDRTAALYAEAVRMAPCDPRPRLEQAGFLVEQGKTGDARATLLAALDIEPNYRRARLLLADLDDRDARSEDAAKALDALLASDAALRDYVPDSPYAAEIVRDAPAERQQITSRIRPASPSKHGSSAASSISGQGASRTLY